jgi:hypothetical protein
MTMRSWTYVGGLLCAAALGATPAGASSEAGASPELGADAVLKLVSGRTWLTEKILDSRNTGVMAWKKDGTVCLHIGGDASGKCHDTGTWKMSGTRVCYQMTWWGKSQGILSECLGVADLGNGRYQARIPSGSRVWEFTLAR